MESAGLWMLLAVAIVLLGSGLPAYAVLMGVSALFAVVGLLAGALDYGLLTALPSRIIGLLETDLLQALPLYVFMGALLNRLPLADRLFRCGIALGGTPSVATLGLGALLAPMNGSVGASVAMLARSIAPKLEARGVPAAESTALVCVASTLGVVIPPSLVLILLGDAMMRAHTEATNVTKEMVRIVNTQDVFRGALAPAALFLGLSLVVAWWLGRKSSGKPSARGAAEKPSAMEWATAIVAGAFVIGLLAGVAAGYFYAVEAAAMGGTALLLFGLATGGLKGGVFGHVLRDTMAVSGALFALFVAATTFTLLFRAFGTDHLLDASVKLVPGGATGAAITVLVVFALSAFVLDAFEIVFVIVPIVMPSILTRAPDAVWISVLALLALQASFLVPPSGYAVMMARSQMKQKTAIGPLARALAPYIGAQLVVLVLVVLVPALAHLAEPKSASSPQNAPKLDDDAARSRFNDMLKLPPPPE